MRQATRQRIAVSTTEESEQTARPWPRKHFSIESSSNSHRPAVVPLQLLILQPL